MKRRRRMIRAAVAVVVSTALTGGTNGAVALEGDTAGVEPEPMSLTGCSVAYVGFLVDAAKVSADVPPPFKVYPYGVGQAALVVKTYSCEALHSGGSAAVPIKYSSVGVRVEPPDGETAPFHSYTFWKLTDNADLLSRLRSVGARPEMFKAIALTTTDGPLSSSMTVDVPWKGSPYRYSIDDSALGREIVYGFTFWEGGGGAPIVRMNFVNERVMNHTGVGRLSTSEGSRLAHYLGGSSAVAAVAEAKLQASVKRVEISRWVS